MVTKAKKPKAPPAVKPIKPDNRAFDARAVAQPEVLAAAMIRELSDGQVDLNFMIQELRVQIAEVQKGDMRRPEAMLVAQAHTLDSLFNNLSFRSQGNMVARYGEAAERYMKLALKAQSQCIRTIEALGELKNPRAVAFVKQANIAHGPQQINNGGPGESLAHGNNPISSNELSGGGHELLPDTRASALESRIDTPVEAVGEVYRATD